MHFHRVPATFSAAGSRRTRPPNGKVDFTEKEVLVEEAHQLSGDRGVAVVSTGAGDGVVAAVALLPTPFQPFLL